MIAAKSREVLVWTSCILAASVCLYMVASNLRLVALQSLQEFREDSTILTTQLMLRGTNPYSLAVHPAHNNNYGILYQLLVYPFARIWDALYSGA